MTANKNHVSSSVLLLFLLLFTGSHSEARDSLSFIQYFPGRKIFPRFTADGREHQLSLSAITKNREWIGAVGASIPLLQLNPDDMEMQAGVAATVTNRLIKTPGHLEVSTVDYRVDIPLDVRFSRISLRTGLGHISCHLADDAIELHGKKSIQHANDYVMLAAAYDVSEILGYLYTGANYSYGTQPVANKPWLLQVGADFGNFQIYDEVSLYGAVDIKIKEEVGWGSTQSYQFGLKLFPREPRVLRIAYTLRTGYDDRGQFYLSRDTLHLFSVFIDL